jgi:transaldolase
MRFNDSDVLVRSRIDTPVDPRIFEQLMSKFPDFGRAYRLDGLAAAEFDGFGPTVRTLRQFIEACHELAGYVRDVMLPNPDKA